MEINGSMVEGFYSRYISRDLADLLGGGVFIVIFWYSFRELLHGISWYDYLPPILWEQPLRLISSLAVCYLVGFYFDRRGDELSQKIVPFYCKYQSIGFFKQKPPYLNPFVVLNGYKIPNYESDIVIRQALIENVMRGY